MFLCGLVGCDSASTAGWGVNEVILVHNSIGGTIMNNITMNGVPPYYGGEGKYRPTITTGQEVQIPVRYTNSYDYVELKLDVLDTNYNHLGIARRRVYVGNRYSGYGSRSPEMWNVRNYERIVPVERAGN